MLDLDCPIEGLNRGILRIDNDDPRKTREVLLTESRLDLVDEIVNDAGLVATDPGSRNDQIPPVRRVLAHEQCEEDEGPLLLSNAGFELAKLV
jgi:hypothetical protein